VLRGQQHRLQRGLGLAVGAVREEGIVAPGPQMRIERVDPLVGRRLHHDAPAALERFLQKLRQHAFDRLALQVIEEDLGHSLSRQPSYSSATSRSSSRTPQPEPQLRFVSEEPDAKPVPAMSRCAHGVLPTKRPMNCAAVIEPPERPPVFFMSANFESISLSYSGPSGMRHTRSPVSSPALMS